MTTPDTERLLQELFDGTISEDDSCRLEEQLALDPSLARAYRDYALLHAGLVARAERSHLTPLSSFPTPAVAAKLRRSRRIQGTVSVLAAAALFVVIGVVLRMIFVAPPEAVLAYRSAADSTFAIIHHDDAARTTEPGTVAIGTTIELSQGTMELRFEKEVRGVVTAPAKFTLEEPLRLHLATGNAWFNVPVGAEGFQVRTTGFLATDLGTEFGVVTVPGSTDEIHVLQGAVEVACSYGQMERATLRAGESRATTPTGTLVEAPRLATPFQTGLPDRLRYIHFPFDGAADQPLTARGNHPALADLTIEARQSDGRPVASRRIPGRVGNALAFDGKGDRVRTNWPGVYGSSPVTIACWARVRGKPTYGALAGWGLGKRDSDRPHQWKLVLAPPYKPKAEHRIFRCSWGEGNMIGANADVRANEWHHYAVVFTGGSDATSPQTLRFYIDGQPVPVRNQNFPTPPQRPPDLLGAEPLTIGASLAAEPKSIELSHFRGAIDELFIIEGALSDSQIRELYERNTYSPAPE